MTDGIDLPALGEPFDAVVVASRAHTAHCRLLGASFQLTLQTSHRDAIPGEILTVVALKQWWRVGRLHAATRFVFSVL
jgi:hypothetical protein